ncbi:hypothetical protein GRZ59_15660 [Lactobacillus paracasei]|uniref:hypothetical protein n=1 Tax=Lacticaseibacillus paracasei TaxID=1597 RepID=UPI0013718949|nr:hypothetical protein [Lacticaseibacillus paracasei]MXI85099.1 hypothetical protein [Lacticaseibacillus paracasei]
MTNSNHDLIATQHLPLVVAAILSTTEIVANGGINKNIHEGQVYRILDRHGAEITDPITGLVIGRLSGTKYRLRVVDVHEQMSVMRLIAENTRDSFYLKNLKTMSSSRGMLIAHPEQMNDSNNSLTHAPVRIGDFLELEF